MVFKSSWMQSPGWKLLFLCIGVLVVMPGCTPKSNSDGDPKKRVMDYISQSFAVRELSDREALLDHLTGDAKYRLAAWSDEQFRAVFLESKRRFVNIKFHDVKRVNDSRYDITYDMVYIDEGRLAEQTDANSKDGIAKITQRKLCQVISDRGKWLISEVRSVKELVEYMGEMSLP